MPHSEDKTYRQHVTEPGQRMLRQDILKRVMSDVAPNVVILQAPAGHGKSTVMRQLRGACETRGLQCAWLTLDESDNDSRRHAKHLRLMLDKLIPRLSVKASRELDYSESGNQFEQRADWLIDRMADSGADMALFIDDFESITNQSVLSFWRDFLYRCPDNVRVFVATRNAVQAGVARLLVANRVLLVLADDLRFSQAEVRTFFSTAVELSISQDDVDQVHLRTEGWPAAVQLFRLGLSKLSAQSTLQRLDNYRPRELAEYLTECVLSDQSIDIRSFLLRTCILNRLNAQICNELSGRSDAQSVLINLERAGLFVRAMDLTQSWFSYHSLFASYLREQLLSGEADTYRLLHAQAARWFFNHRHFQDALHHAVAANDLSLAADILELWSADLVADGEMSIAERWFDCIPLVEIKKRPALRYRIAWALIFLGRRSKLAQLLGTSDSQTEYPNDSLAMHAMASICADDMSGAFKQIVGVVNKSGDLDRFEAFALAAAANLDAFRNLVIGDLDESQNRIAAAQIYNHQGSAIFSGGYTSCLEGVSHIIKGHLKSALTVLRSGLADQRQVLDSAFGSAPLASCYIWALYEANEFDVALAVFDEYHDMVLESAIPDFFAISMICVSRIHAACGRREESLAILANAEAIANRNSWPRVVQLFKSERLRANLTSNNLHNIPSQLSALRQATPTIPADWLPVSELLESRKISSVRVSIYKEQFDEASAELSALQTDRPGYLYYSIRLSILQAIVLKKRGLGLASLRHLSSALRSAESDGYIRLILDEGEAVVDLLKELVASTEGADPTPILAFARKLISIARASSDSQILPPEIALIDIDQFSDKEQEILGYLSARLSNQEMAQRSCVSTNTVKYHLKNIYRKLDVARRIDAYNLLPRLRSNSNTTKPEPQLLN
ncbi:LuxR C-terminal-related transcriptional regulator [Stenotrophobium rhamnosiphilum]|uniref:Helix-turn-helix transcriptional regulator n=1 Tax=Stenotrophobium rhamnosiphilum TaxID=2029166 RepID=A0A2T5ME99_9GAMM|nr:LuxR C-terminal-related transcriptional regulator [Stenotrophobium rhamnosiphilum]PTU30910.1 helix-turn-helix transcriptional regulator [Stenotrophobium rhamnosiphilum]